MASRLWTLDPDTTFLNHGSFGACPAEVLEIQHGLRARMERQPVQFLSRDLDELIHEARMALGRFLNSDADDLAFVANATSGVNTVLRSLAFEPGDELLVTDHAYNACRNALEFVAGRSGAHVVIAPVPFPLDSPDDVLEAVLAAVSQRTRLALVDHVTSPTGLIFPVERLVAALQARGVDVLVDGAHAPGMIPIDLRGLGAAYYTGNAHKWLCAPKGSAFLWVRPDRQPGVHPLTISHGFNVVRADRSRFRLEFDWTGTIDPTAALCIPIALRFMEARLPGGWPALMERNHRLALEGRRALCDVLGVAPPCPDAMIGALAAIPLPDGEESGPSRSGGDPLQRALREQFGIEVPVIAWPAAPKRLLRISAQLYNTLADFQRLARALRARLP
jgi:isopenicillin-N epimerase